jgi:hypothetical protein
VRFCFDDETLRDKAKQQEDRSQEVIRLLITQTDPSGGEIDALSEVPVSPIMYGELSEAIAKVSSTSLSPGRLCPMLNMFRYTMVLSFVSTQHHPHLSIFVWE